MRKIFLCPETEIKLHQSLVPILSISATKSVERPILQSNFTAKEQKFAVVVKCVSKLGMSDEKKLHRISGSSLLLNENEENPNSYEQTTKCKVGQIKVSESDESNSESCPGIFSGLSDLSPNNCNLTFYSDSYRYGYTICFQYSLQVRTSSENRTEREDVIKTNGRSGKTGDNPGEI